MARGLNEGPLTLGFTETLKATVVNVNVQELYDIHRLINEVVSRVQISEHRPELREA